MERTARTYVAGHSGLVGSALCRRLEAEGCTRLLVRPQQELDLTRQPDVEQFFAEERPEHVFLAAARVGGIHANHTHPAEFIYDNLAIQTNVIHAAWKYGARKLLFLGSSCIYPRMAPQPLKEEHLLTGPLEPTNRWYAMAKLAGLTMAQGYRRQYGFRTVCLMPTNLYGPGDNFDLEHSHVVPALIRKFHQAKVSGAAEVVVWGTGAARREFLHVDDLADAAVFLMRQYDDERIINVGCGEDLSIAELCQMVSEVAGYRGRIRFDADRPDGAPRKLLDVSRLFALGWRPRIGLRAGLERTYVWYCEHYADVAAAAR